MTDARTITESGASPGVAWLEAMAQRVIDHQLVPVISASVGDELVLGDYSALEKAYADQYHVPQGGLPEMAQVASIIDPSLRDLPAVKESYIRFLRKRLVESVADKVEANIVQEAKLQSGATFSKFCDLMQYPQFEDNSSLLTLAKFDLPVYVTTSYHGFLESALRSLGKRPRTEFCRWNRKLERLPKDILDGLPKGIDRDYEPTVQEPLVYHLRGYDAAKDSLAMTEDEHLRLLVACSNNNPGVDDPVHVLVRAALEASSLILLGYNLRSWEFRLILWGLLLPRKDKAMQSVSIQVVGDVDQRYFNKYMRSPDIHLEAYWGTVQQYIEIVRQAVERAKADG